MTDAQTKAVVLAILTLRERKKDSVELLSMEEYEHLAETINRNAQRYVLHQGPGTDREVAATYTLLGFDMAVGEASE